MEKLQRFVKLSLIPMTILLPAWLLVGRALLGSLGWLTLIMFFTVAPAVLLGMIVLTIVTLRNKQVRATGRVSYWHALTTMAFYLLFILFGFFLVDGGDTEESIASAASHIFGSGFIAVSSLLALTFGIIALISGVAALVVAIVELVAEKRTEKTPPNK